MTIWKEKAKYVTIGVAIGAVLTASVGVGAANGGAALQVVAKKMKFVFDGTEHTIPEGKGASFIYEGTTYVPLRFMSEALGKFVQYDAARETIYVGNRYKAAPAMTIDPSKTYRATIETTKGAIEIELYAADAPVAVNNFVFLAKEGFYDNVIFHRVIKDFVIQAGDPTGTGRGGPGYSFADELDNGHRYETGVVAMANAGPNTNGSQFFIRVGDESEALNNYPNYTIFGKVVSGLDVALDIAASPVAAAEGSGEASRPIEPIAMKRVTIVEESR